MLTSPKRPCSASKALAIVAPAAALWMAASPAAAQGLCETYVVRKGDTLSRIAADAGVAGGFQVLFSANSDVLRDPNLIEVGQRLRIPCADGSLPGTASAAPATPAPETAAAAEPAATPAPAEPAAAAPSDLPAIRFLTGGNYAPFTDQELPQQGMFTELVTTALKLNPSPPDYTVSFVDDWGEHLTVLLPTGAFDMGFPWYRPDCGLIDYLGEDSRNRCNNYNFSEPFYEAVVGYYTLKGSAFEAATTPDQLRGARLCRPQGWFTFDLEARQLIEPNVSMTVPGTQIECMEALIAGNVDVVTYDALPAEEDIRTLGIGDRVTELADLAGLATLHVVTPKTNPNGEAYLALLNNGLAELRNNGEWFAIVSRQLGASQ